ncbi:deoxyribose-phosphate aldolase [Ornithinibacillus bavariensis]|uniref:Deoxyribose-phosphate aldolase n=1 Tax=Ornithinibacillus bavariensis TaxID=545502 RepID=A0A920C5R3_9BACI|nr:deoxyribose-phosphate aldolase [Ornithinibacillus bavariensis]GIO27010.1 2-deoxyribose-5-phosphate aldolase [Ornithinibacillus bavariensis]HAM80085.1 deoxyribose-phosphate aldolase [Ornithinibacillus sp.]
MNKEELISIIDYTLLKPTATKEDIKLFCEETIEYGFKTVFVNPYYVSYAHRLLSSHGIKVGVPIGFSLGGATTHVKVEETKEAIKNGATEIDMLINLGALKSGEYDVVRDDIAAVVKAANGLTTKVIIETALLSDDEKVKATELIMEAGADFVKTATGFNGGGATEKDVKLLHSVAGDKLGVKAAGGIKTYEDAVKIVKAGATRIGASGATAIINGGVSTSSY